MPPKILHSPTILLKKSAARIIERWITSQYWLFLKDCVFTVDERYSGAGLEPVRPFPVEEPYLQFLWWRAWNKRRIADNKFRQGMATNLYCVARKLVFALFFEGSKNYILKRAFNEADDILKTRIVNVYKNIPDEITVTHQDGTIDKMCPKEIL